MQKRCQNFKNLGVYEMKFMLGNWKTVIKNFF